jgi:biopolymer transport protein ExbD
MPAKPPKTFDVWFKAANTVYRAVPYHVVADWTQQGRLGRTDQLRPAGMEVPWKPVGEWELFSDYLPRPVPTVAVPGAAPGAAIAVPDAPEEETLFTTRRPVEEDDDVDMIPLIDISMVLLVFFIIVSAAGALSPVDVPDMTYGGELRTDPEAITISIEKANAEDVHYSVRAGQNPATAEMSHLPNPEAALKALDELLGQRIRPPEVRVACEKDLPSERVIELSKELKKRLDQRKINSFVATVNEAPKK